MAVLGTIYGTLTGVDDWPAYWAYVALGLVSWNTLATPSPPAAPFSNAPASACSTNPCPSAWW